MHTKKAEDMFDQSFEYEMNKVAYWADMVDYQNPDLSEGERMRAGRQGAVAMSNTKDMGGKGKAITYAALMSTLGSLGYAIGGGARAAALGSAAGIGLGALAIREGNKRRKGTRDAGNKFLAMPREDQDSLMRKEISRFDSDE